MFLKKTLMSGFRGSGIFLLIALDSFGRNEDKHSHGIDTVD